MKPSQPFKNPYERLYNKSLTTEQVAEMRFNLVRYLELLILLDQQNKEWLKAHEKDAIDSTRNTEDERSVGTITKRAILTKEIQQ